jgi:hypothetical protein
MNIKDFWDITPYEFTFYVQAFIDEMKQKQEDWITQAYLTAYWHRVKKMPNLKEILGKKPQEQTPNQMLEEIKKLNASMGGSTY